MSGLIHKTLISNVLINYTHFLEILKGHKLTKKSLFRLFQNGGGGGIRTPKNTFRNFQ